MMTYSIRNSKGKKISIEDIHDNYALGSEKTQEKHQEMEVELLRENKVKFFLIQKYCD